MILQRSLQIQPPPDVKVYPQGDTSQRLNELQITRKYGSTKAYQLFTLWNIHVRKMFLEHPLPFGIHGTTRRRFIDIDECSVERWSTHRKYGYDHYWDLVRKPGVYSRDPGDPRLPRSIYGSIKEGTLSYCTESHSTLHSILLSHLIGSLFVWPNGHTFSIIRGN